MVGGGLLAHLGKTEADDEPLSFITILDALRLCDALYTTRSAPQYDKDWRLFAVWCVRNSLFFETVDRDWRRLRASNRGTIRPRDGDPIAAERRQRGHCEAARLASH